MISLAFYSAPLSRSCLRFVGKGLVRLLFTLLAVSTVAHADVFGTAQSGPADTAIADRLAKLEQELGNLREKGSASKSTAGSSELPAEAGSGVDAKQQALIDEVYKVDVVGRVNGLNMVRLGNKRVVLLSDKELPAMVARERAKAVQYLTARGFDLWGTPGANAPAAPSVPAANAAIGNTAGTVSGAAAKAKSPFMLPPPPAPPVAQPSAPAAQPASGPAKNP